MELADGGTLLLDIEVPYADTKQWPYWLKEERESLPKPPRPPRERKRASDGSEYALSARIVELDPLEHQIHGIIKQAVARGHMQINVSLARHTAGAASLNRELFDLYLLALREAAERYQIAGHDITWAPGQFALHPGPKGVYSVARWTATADGSRSPCR